MINDFNEPCKCFNSLALYRRKVYLAVTEVENAVKAKYKPENINILVPKMIRSVLYMKR